MTNEHDDPRTGDVPTVPQAPSTDGSAAGGSPGSVTPYFPAAGPRYRVLRSHARGGLGEVFLARDEELGREVALKEIQSRHADHPESRARFVLEAEVTGGLEHPGIVPVYSLGRHPDGRPYYAMRFVRGEDLAEAIDRFHEDDKSGRDPGERSLALRALLRRFVDVCNAVAYAHSRGVLHRDLKPRNVMLGDFGETLVVDWGLAKATGTVGGDVAEPGPLRPSSSSFPTSTQAGQAIGTPAYMSPEQAAGQADRIGPVSDVYSLGATLYALLTGRDPFFHRDVRIVLFNVERGTFPPPRRVNPRVPPALESVCLKAMALKPEDRYGSARDLSEDVEKWLADEKVSAYREPWRERAERWARRHKTGVASAAAVLLTAAVTSTVGFGLVERQRRDAVEARKEAEGARDRADASARVADDQARLALRTLGLFVEGVQEQTEHRAGLLPLRAQLLEMATDGLRDVVRTAETAGRVDRNTALARQKLAEIFLQTGRTAEAAAEARAAREVFARLVENDPDGRQARQDLAVAVMVVGDVLLHQGDTAAARQAFRDGLAINEGLLADDARDAEARRQLARCHERIGHIDLAQADAASARKALQQCLEARQALAEAEPESKTARRDLFIAYVKLGDLSLQQRDIEAAREAYRNGLEISRRLADEDRENVRAQRELASAHDKVGNLHARLGQWPAAREAYGKALEVRAPLAKANPDNAQVRRELSISHEKVGHVELARGEVGSAREAFRQALEISERLAQDDPANAQARRDLSVSLERYGDVSWQSGDLDAGRRAYEQMRPLRERLVETAPGSVEARADLALGFYKSGLLEQRARAYAAAAEHYQRCLDVLALLDQEGKLKGMPQSVGVRGSAAHLLAVCRAAPEAVRDEATALAGPGPLAAGLLAVRARDLALQGRHLEAAASAAKLRDLAPKAPANLYAAACGYALCAAAVARGREASALSVLERPAFDRYAARAAELLREAVANGFADLARLKIDADLAALRPRDDFRDLVRQLESKANPPGK